MFSSKFADGIRPYVAGEQSKKSGIIKLNTNENPYPPTPEIQGVLEKFDIGALRLYNDPNNTELKEKLAVYEDVEAGNIFVGNGSDEILAMAFRAFADNAVAFREVTYSFYEVYCALFNLKASIIPVDEQLKVSIRQYLHIKADLLVICNPNAPTGQQLGIAEIERIVKSNSDKAVLIDEAYAPFSKISAVSLTKRYPNLIVVKTFSKAFSLAGIRCGYAVANSALIDALNKIKNSFNSYTVNAITEKVACAALDDADYIRITTDAIIAAREMTTRMLNELEFNVLPSETNFVFATHPVVPAEHLYEQLKGMNILVRYFNRPKIDNYLRITIGTVENMIALHSALKAIIAAYKGKIK